MGTVVNMQALSSLGVLVLVLTLVRGDYWWMDTQAFSGQGNSDSQVKRTSSGGGYGGGGNKRKTQNTGGSQQNVLHLSDKFQDSADTSCPAGSICVHQSECQQTPVSGLQERVANYLRCSPNKICCFTSNVPTSTDPLPSSGSSLSSSSILQPPPGVVSLPETQCSEGWKCVSELFCDVTATMVQFRVELTAEERNKRGELTPCMNQVTRQFDVCCRKPSSFPQLENNKIVTSQRQETREPTCPNINILPPIEQCRGRPSNCWSVGVADTDCIGNALCCFDGCANVCQGEGPINGNPGPQTNGRGQQRQQTINSANLNINSNKQEVFQLITQPPIKEQLGASSVSIQNTKQNNRGQPLLIQNQPLIQSIQKKPAIIISSTQIPTHPVDKQPTVANTGNNEFVPEAGGGYGNSQLDITSRPIKQEQSIPPVYKNKDSFIFPEDNEEPRFPTFPKKRNPSYSNTSPVTLETEEHHTTPIQVTQPNPIQDIVPNTIQVPQSSLSKEIQQNPVQDIQQNPSPSQQSGDPASSQPFVTCPSA